MVLDKSGSMHHIRSKIIENVNKFIKEQQTLVDNTRFCLITFADEPKITIQPTNMSEIKLLTSNDYSPDGNTALYDSIGMAIDTFADCGSALVVIVTDGDENYSKHYNYKTINSLIESKKALGWNFIYLCDNLKSEESGCSLGINKSAPCAMYSKSNNISVPTRDMPEVLSKQVSEAATSYRKLGVVQNLNYASTQVPSNINAAPTTTNNTHIELNLNPTSSTTIDNLSGSYMHLSNRNQ
jgi:hypothetical protein